MMAAPIDRSVICPIVIGRDDELTRIDRLIAEVAGGGRTLLISGDAGIGKSRILDEVITRFRDRMAGRQPVVITSRCTEHDLGVPYAPLIAVLRQMAGLTDAGWDDLGASDRAILAPLIPEAGPESLSGSSWLAENPVQQRRRVADAVSRVLNALAGRGPVLLAIEDLHWSDDTSLEVILSLARRGASLPVLTVLTYRSDEPHPTLRHMLASLDRERLAVELALPPLEKDDVERMIRAIFQQAQPVRPNFLNTLYALTGGNAFFIEETLKSLVAAGEIFYREGGWDRRALADLMIPRTIQDAVEQRLAGLRPAAVRVLSFAAVAGQRVEFDLLRDLAGMSEDALLDIMKELINAQLLIEESADHCVFRHALTREAIYTRLLVRERRALHQMIAERIEARPSAGQGGDVADLAYHYERAEVWSKALVYSRRAGERAQRLYAPRVAEEHYSHAILAAGEVGEPNVADLHYLRGQTREWLGDFDGAREDYETALDGAMAIGDREAEWRVLIGLGVVWSGRDYLRSGEYYERAYAIVQTLDDPESLAESLNRVGNSRLRMERTHEALDSLQRALEVFSALDNQAGMAETLSQLGMACQVAGDLRGAAEYYGRAIGRQQALDDRHGLVFSLATRAVHASAYHSDLAAPGGDTLDDAIADGERALGLAEEIEWHAGEAYACARLVFALGARGAYRRALALARSGLALADYIAHRQWMAAAHCGLGTLFLDLLNPTMARLDLELAVRLGDGVGSLSWRRATAAQLALAYIDRRQLSAAETVLGEAMSGDPPMDTLAQRVAWHARARLMLAQGDIDHAQAIAADLLSAAGATRERQIVIPRLSLLHAECRIAAGAAREAVAVLQPALNTAIERGVPPLVWRANLLLGQCFESLDAPDEADRAYAAARKTITELAAQLDDDDLRVTFSTRALADIPAPRNATVLREAGDVLVGLTPRESEVAMLVARGLSNREIAEDLYIGERTVETHVSNILAKLAFNSRTQIVAWALSHGVDAPAASDVR